jgi:pimeloyl-ACP methyl ester carboxylesterase
VVSVQVLPLAVREAGADTPVVSDRDRIKYAKSGNVAIAYAVYGQGPPDLVFVHGFAGNIEIENEHPIPAGFHERLAGFSRLIIFDRRGTGLSDRLREPATLEVRMDDLRAVLDAVGSERAVLFGTFEAASMCLLFGATYPERTSGLVLYNPVARGSWAPDYPWAPRPRSGVVKPSSWWLAGAHTPRQRTGSAVWPSRTRRTPTSSPGLPASGGSPRARARSRPSGGWLPTWTSVTSCRQFVCPR